MLPPFQDPPPMGPICVAQRGQTGAPRTAQWAQTSGNSTGGDWTSGAWEFYMSTWFSNVPEGFDFGWTTVWWTED